MLRLVSLRHSLQWLLRVSLGRAQKQRIPDFERYYLIFHMRQELPPTIFLGGWMSYFLGDMRGTNINMAFGWFLWWPRSLPDFTMSHKCVHEAHEEVYHPGDRHFQKSVSSDLTGLNRKEIHPVTRISGLVNSVAPWFHQGARFFPAFSSAILRRLAFLHTGLEMAASVPGFTSSLNNSRWKRNRVLFCIVLFFPLCVLPLFKAKKLLGIL